MQLEKRARLKTISFQVVLTMSGIALGIYAFELAFRQFFLVHMVPQTEREFEAIVASNWPRPVEIEKPPGTFRILGLADSFGVAGGAANYHFLLEQALAKTGLRVEMVNLSVPTYSPAESLELLRRWAARYQPDLVLHGVFVGNDFTRPGPRRLTYRGISVDDVRGIDSWYPQNLTSLQWLAEWRVVVADRRMQRTEVDRPSGATFARENFLQIERIRLSICRRPTRTVEPWPHVTRFLDLIADEVHRMKADYVLVVHPDQFQVEAALVGEVMRRGGLKAEDYDLDLPQKYLAAYASSRDRSIVDLTPVFRREGARGGLYIPLDTHYNDAGNRLAAEAVLNTLIPLLARSEGAATSRGEGGVSDGI